MRISSNPTAPSEAFEATNLSTRKLVEAINRRESVFEKITRVRQQVLDPQTPQSRPNRWDSVLCLPEQFKSKFLRGQIHHAKVLEELGEMAADCSGGIERLCRNMMSGGNKPDIAQMASAAIGRVSVSFFNAPGFAVHKAVGAGFYLASSLLGALCIGLAATRLGKKRSPEELQRKLQNSRFTDCMAKTSARFLEKRKEAWMGKLYQKAQQSSECSPLLKSVAQKLSRRLRAQGPETHMARRFHSAYIWNNLHQYGPVTQGLMKAAHLVFNVVNKLGGSFDKYLGSALGSLVFKQGVGRMLGHRLGMLLAVGCSLGISFPAAPLIIGLSMASAISCGVSISLVLAAKLAARHEGWAGSIAPREKACV